ncbi:MAG: lipoprotein insertase outer membrane protein LolB [Gammaproteobacteria bacterium]|jgi:outer membrane lipoprotein LolB
MKKYLLILVAALEAGCASAPPPLAPVSNPAQVWQQRREQLSHIAYWHLNGRLAVRHGDEAWHINLDWLQRGDNYRIELSGPFGAGEVRLIGNAQGVKLEDSDDHTYYADKPGELLAERTGVTMPVAGLRYWILGLSTPQQKQRPRLDNQGRLAFLEDDHWQVKFRRYANVKGLQLPDKIFISKPAQQIDVRLVVDQWKLGLAD